jgi:hypothetical protein
VLYFIKKKNFTTLTYLKYAGCSISLAIFHTQRKDKCTNNFSPLDDCCSTLPAGLNYLPGTDFKITLQKVLPPAQNGYIALVKNV